MNKKENKIKKQKPKYSISEMNIAESFLMVADYTSTSVFDLNPIREIFEAFVMQRVKGSDGIYCKVCIDSGKDKWVLEKDFDRYYKIIEIIK
jgi:hypothetical protein